MRDLWRKAIYLYSLAFQNELKSLDVANIPHKPFLATCKAIDKVHPKNRDDTDNANDAENDRNKNDSEHFTVLLSGVNVFSLTK